LKELIEIKRTFDGAEFGEIVTNEIMGKFQLRSQIITGTISKLDCFV
jgi:hypothetical protein